MNGFTFHNSFKSLLLTVFLLAAFQSAFSQQSLTEKRNDFFSINNKSEKTVSMTRQRVFKVSNIEQKELKAAAESKISSNIFDLEHRVFVLVNQRRIEAGLPALIWSNDAAKMARIHSENMANFRFFSHTDMNGKKVNERANAIGLKSWHQIGENIAFNRGFKSPLESAVQSWMNSAGHRENILKTDWEDSGIGVAVTAEGTYYFTQVFLKK
jgi:uncharacterized protein YkwD